MRDCVVVGLERDGNAEPCAVMLLRESSMNSDAVAGAIVRRANTQSRAISADAKVDRLAGYRLPANANTETDP